MTPTEKTENVDFRVTLLQDGKIECKFLSGEKELFCLFFGPDQVGGLATALLAGAHGSCQLVGGHTEKPQTGNIELNIALPVRNWYFGDTATRGQKAVIVEIGNTKIGFIVNSDQMRALGRAIIGASWKTGSARLSFGQLLREFGAELRFWLLLFWSRQTAAVKRRANDLFSRFVGRSFRPFYSVLISPGLPSPEYPPLGRCVYCGETTYSRNAFARKYPLGAEHIIAEGLGGTLELPEASCQECEKATGAMVEGDVLGRTMKAIRVHFRLKKSGSGPFPKTLPLQAKVLGQQKTIEVPIEDYPIIFVMYAYAPPDIDRVDGMPMVTAAVLARVKHDERLLFQKYGIGEFATPYLDNVMLCRMLAKIGHALAVAELGSAAFKPLLIDLIKTGSDRRTMRFVGGALNSVPVPPNTLHYLALGYEKIKNRTYVVAHVRLFASYDAPTYAVIVGESTESFIKRFKRIVQARSYRGRRGG